MDIKALNRALGRVPRYMAVHVHEYLNDGIPPCDFLRRVLENDLYGAALQADNSNANALFGWACVLNALPLNVWGSREKVDAYLASRREATLTLEVRDE